MQDEAYIAIPLRRRDGSIRAYAKISPEDAALAELRWSLRGRGYAGRSVWEDDRCRCFLLHRVILGLEHGDPREGDHINRDRLDSRRANLRILAPGQNEQNLAPRMGASAYRGVCWMPGRDRWYVRVSVAGRRHHVGYFEHEEDANAAAVAFRLAHLPFTVEV